MVIGEAVGFIKRLLELTPTNVHTDWKLHAVLTDLIVRIPKGHSSSVTKAVCETVLFNTAGQLDRLTLFDLAALPQGRPRVRQFSVSGMTRKGLSQVLVNCAHTREAEGLPGTPAKPTLPMGPRLRSRRSDDRHFGSPFAAC